MRTKECTPMFVNECTDMFFPPKVSTHASASELEVIQCHLYHLSPEIISVACLRQSQPQQYCERLEVNRQQTDSTQSNDAAAGRCLFTSFSYG